MEHEKHPQDDLKMMKSLKNVKMRNAHRRNWNMASKLKITENEEYTFQDMKYSKEN